MKNNIYKNRQNFNSNGNNKRIKNEKLRNILSWLLIGILCFTIIGSVLGTIAFGKTHTASADSVSSYYEYEGNNFFVPCTTSEGRYGYTGAIHFLSVDVVLKLQPVKINNVSNSLGTTFYCILPDITVYLDSRFKPMNMEFIPSPYISNELATQSYDENIYFSLYPYSSLVNIGANGSLTQVYSLSNITNNTLISYNGYLNYVDGDTTGYIGYFGNVRYTSQIGFNADVYSVTYKSTVIENYATNFDQVTNYVRYLDKNGYYAEFSFISMVRRSSVWTGVVAWEERTYYLENAFSDNTLYEQGFETGYNDGKYDGVVQYKDSSQFSEDAHDKFYNKFIEEYKESSSFKTLIEQAKESGRMEERAEGSNVTFTNTLSAMYNAPLGAFRDFLDFELLGVNMLGFFTGLFTIAFVLFVIKKLT